MRVLSFVPGERLFERIYTSLVLSPLQLRDRSQQKTHGRLLDKMEAIGTLQPATDDQGNERPHKPTDVKLYACFSGGVARLEESEYELAKAHCDAAIPVTHKALSRELESAIAFLEAIPETKPEEPESAKV